MPAVSAASAEALTALLAVYVDLALAQAGRLSHVRPPVAAQVPELRPAAACGCGWAGRIPSAAVRAGTGGPSCTGGGHVLLPRGHGLTGHR
jgi:Na+-translocating ferredoxin:NAD+ oxidoreductase RNF subunit RnfB